MEQLTPGGWANLWQGPPYPARTTLTEGFFSGNADFQGVQGAVGRTRGTCGAGGCAVVVKTQATSMCYAAASAALQITQPSPGFPGGIFFHF